MGSADMARVGKTQKELETGIESATGGLLIH